MIIEEASGGPKLDKASSGVFNQKMKSTLAGSNKIVKASGGTEAEKYVIFPVTTSFTSSRYFSNLFY